MFFELFIKHFVTHLTPFNIMITWLWFISAVLDYFGYAYYWQLKWYRWDRFKDFLQTEQGKKFLTRYSILWRSLIAIIVFFIPINSYVVIKYVVGLFFAIDTLRLVYLFFKKKLLRPDFTKKSVSMMLLALATEMLWLMYTHDWAVLLLVLMLRFFILAFYVYILNLCTRLIKKMYATRATKKMQQYPHLTVIGITGSYAKTSVKNFLAELLSSKFNVVKTPKNMNSHFGIMRFILNTDFSDKDIFVVEIGADEIGDVEYICNIVKPKVGILTAINEQHLATFGSIQNTQQAKYEILRAIPKDGLAITNSDNPYCREFLHELPCEIATFGMDEEYHPTLLIKDLGSNKTGIYCTSELTWKGEVSTREVQTHLCGEHNILNLAPCTLAGLFLGMTRDEIIATEMHQDKMESGIKVYPYGTSSIIDDSYNSNPDGFKAALNLFNAYQSERKRIVITRGMIELSDKSNELHEKIAGEISFVADELVIITPDFVEPLRKGAFASKYKLNIIEIFEPKKLLKYIKSLKDTDAVVLMENRIPEIVIDEVKYNQ